MVFGVQILPLGAFHQQSQLQVVIFSWVQLVLPGIGARSAPSQGYDFAAVVEVDGDPFGVGDVEPQNHLFRLAFQSRFRRVERDALLKGHPDVRGALRGIGIDPIFGCPMGGNVRQ